MRKGVFAKKKLVFAVGFLCFMAMLDAQQASNGFLLSGEVIYQEIVKMDIQLEGVDAQLADQIPKERKTEKVLHFTEEEAVFENHQKDDPEEAMHMEGSGIMIKMYQPDNKTYIDLKNKKVIEQKEFMSRVFLIESELEPTKWKMTGEQKEILDYACQEAITQVEGKDVHAWFTPQIGVAAGPGKYCNLPGLVLAVEMHDGDLTLEAIGIELKPVDQSVLKKPTKGKKVTRDEYQAIVAEKMKEMGVEGDGNGAASTHSVVVRIQQ
jgi:GLPGLI family protein